MRLQLKFDSGAGQIQIPQDFRRTFISLLKTLLQKTMWFSRYEMDRPGYVPFCTGVEFGKIIEVDSAAKQIIVAGPIIFTISTGDYELFADIYNGSIINKDRLKVFGLLLGDVILCPPVSIKENFVLFKTIGHMVLPSANGYLSETDSSQWEESINYHMLNRAN